MRLRAASGNSFELLVLRYEFPDVTEDRWDANWLVVSGKITTAENGWRFVHPCVTTFELADLAEWLETLGSDGDQYAFTEPNLLFTYSTEPAPVLRVRFAHESAPPWVQGEPPDLTLDFPLDETDVRAAASDLRDALIEYPIRGGAA